MLESQLIHGELKSEEQGKNEPDYLITSLVFIDDDSVRLIDRKTGKEFWATREFKDGKYTGNLVLEDGELVKRVQASLPEQPRIKEPQTKKFVMGGEMTGGYSSGYNFTRNSFYFSDDSLSTFLKELSLKGYSIKQINIIYNSSNAYSEEHSKESDGFMFSGAEDGSLFKVKLFQDRYYLVGLTIEGGNNRDANGHKTRFYRDNFRLELRNRIIGEWSLKSIGVYRDEGYETSWTEVHGRIEGEKEETIKTLEEIVKNAVTKSKFTNNCVGEV